MKETVTVIIPAHNEEQNICQVIKLVKKDVNVNQIIVVDNVSTDNTRKLAIDEGVQVEYSDIQGKGYAMETGLKKAYNEIIVYIDADVNNYPDNLIELLIEPIIKEEAGFVKAAFNRITGGKVTELVTKPLLDIMFPNMSKFSEPLSGMIATRKSLLEKIEFEKDYGVDVGILIDMFKMGIKVQEVNIGSIENLSHNTKTTEKMVKMSTEVMRTIIKKAKGE